MGEVERGPLRVVPVPDSADALAWHLLQDHALSADHILNWLLIRSERAHDRSQVFSTQSSVEVFLEELHHCEHEYTDKEFDHTHHEEV